MKREKLLLAALLFLYAGASGRLDNAAAASNTLAGAGESSETVFFGNYPQSASGVEPIEWIVLDRQGDRTLLLAKYCLDSRPWHNARTGATWDGSDIRAWLNGEFLRTAFTAAEQDALAISNLDNGDDLRYGTPVGKNTQDRVFLLSGAEASKYFPASGGRTAKPTRYAVSHGAYTNGRGDCAWWLRSPGLTRTSPAYIASAGDIGSRSHEANETIIGIRPAIWVRNERLR